MNDNENKKAPEALSDEALDNVTGGATLEQWMQAFAQYKDQCIVCKTTENVKYYSYRNKLGCFGAQYFCPACRDQKIQQGYEVWEY